MCNGDVRHIVEIVAVLSGGTVFYQEIQHHHAKSQSDNFIANILTTPLGWGLNVSFFWIVAVPAYFYMKKLRAVSFPVPESPRFTDFKGKVVLAMLLFLFFDFFLTYRQ